MSWVLLVVPVGGKGMGGGFLLGVAPPTPSLNTLSGCCQMGLGVRATQGTAHYPSLLLAPSPALGLTLHPSPSHVSSPTPQNYFFSLYLFWGHTCLCSGITLGQFGRLSGMPEIHSGWLCAKQAPPHCYLFGP